MKTDKRFKYEGNNTTKACTRTTSAEMPPNPLLQVHQSVNLKAVILSVWIITVIEGIRIW
jgi:hypothetical protein